MAENKKAEKVKPRDYVTVYGTGKSRFLAKGVATKVHRVAGDKLIAKGQATKTKAEAAAIKPIDPNADKK